MIFVTYECYVLLSFVVLVHHTAGTMEVTATTETSAVTSEVTTVMEILAVPLVAEGGAKAESSAEGDEEITTAHSTKPSFLIPASL